MTSIFTLVSIIISPQTEFWGYIGIIPVRLSIFIVSATQP